MLSGATIEVSSTPLPRAIPLASAAPCGRGGGGGGVTTGVPAASSTDTEDGCIRGWQHQQKFVAAAAAKKDKHPEFVVQPQPHRMSKVTTVCAAGEEINAEKDDCNDGSGWGDDGVITAAAAATPPRAASAAAATATERSWRATYASSLYCLLPSWLLRLRRTGYAPLRDTNTGNAASSSSSSTCAATCNRSNNSAAGGGVGGGTSGANADQPTYGDAPFSTVCLHCHKAVITTVDFRISCIGICLCVLSPLLLGWPGFCLAPFLYVALKDAVHTCPQCRNLIHRQSRVSVPFCGLRDEVVTVKCGSCAVVLSRRYLLLFTALVTLILLFYVLRAGWLGSSLDTIAKGPPTDLTWRQFYEQCGQRSQLGNSLKAGANFRDAFAGKTVQWKGVLKQVKEGFFSSNVLYLIMSPTITVSGAGSQSSSFTGESSSAGSNSAEERTGTNEEATVDIFNQKKKAASERATDWQKSEESSDSSKTASGSGSAEDEDLEEEDRALQRDGADLALAFNGRDLSAKVEKLEPGDSVQFEATLVALGRRGKPSLGRLWDVTLVEKREARQARLAEWRAKKAERQHLLQRLLLPIIGSPFSDFGGFDPFGSFFSSAGGLGGSGVMVIRRQIISPSGTFSVITSSSGDSSGPSITSSFDEEGDITITGGTFHALHDDDEEKRHTTDSSGDATQTAKDHPFDDFSSAEGHVGSLTENRYALSNSSGDNGEVRNQEGHQYLLHVDEESDDDRMIGGVAGNSMYGGHHPTDSRSHRAGVWSENINESDDDDELHWHNAHGEHYDGGTLYFNEVDVHHDLPSVEADATRDALRRTVVPASGPPAAAVHEEKKAPQWHPSDATSNDQEKGDPTLMALKAAVELQRQRRAQEEERAKLEAQRQRQPTSQDGQQTSKPSNEQEQPNQQQKKRDSLPTAGKVNRADENKKSGVQSRSHQQPLQHGVPHRRAQDGADIRDVHANGMTAGSAGGYAPPAVAHVPMEQPRDRPERGMKQQRPAEYNGKTVLESGVASESGAASATAQPPQTGAVATPKVAPTGKYAADTGSRHQ